MSQEPIPLSVIGGFLGAGKTTLLNRLLQGTSGVRYAVIVNDFGDLAIDGDLAAEHGGDTLTFANGCLCCTLGDSLLTTLNDLTRRDAPPDHIVVEASGVADPRQIADMAVLHPGLRRDLSIVLVDAETILEQARDERLKETVERQAAAADLLVLNKCDLVARDRRAKVRDWAARQAPEAPLIETEHARLPLELLFARDEVKPAGPGRDTAKGHDHGALFRSRSVPMVRPLDLAALRAGLTGLPPSVLRAKGFVSLAGKPENLHLVQLVGRRLRIHAWDAGGRAPPRRELVFVGTPDMPSGEWLERALYPPVVGTGLDNSGE